MITGIYCIKNLVTGSFYIGSAARDIIQRWRLHRSNLNLDRHPNYRLQSDWIFYGAPSFSFSVLEECAPDKCVEREQWMIDVFDPYYNIQRIAGSQLGYRHTPETRAKMRASKQNISPETRSKMSISARNRDHPTGWHHSLSARAHMSTAKMGNKNRLGGNKYISPHGAAAPLHRLK